MVQIRPRKAAINLIYGASQTCQLVVCCIWTLKYAMAYWRIGLPKSHVHTALTILVATQHELKRLVAMLNGELTVNLGRARSVKQRSPLD